MHDLTNADVGTQPAEGEAPDVDQRYETRMAWIASLWAALAVLTTVIASWDSWRVSP